MQDALAVANFFIEQAARDEVSDLNVRKLQDLVFCAHGWCLGISKSPLIGADIIANRGGPEIPVVVEHASGYGTKRVAEPLGDMQTSEKTGTPMAVNTPSVPPGHADMKVLNLTWKAYGKLNAFDLSRVTQAVDGPWDQTWNNPERTSGMPLKIPQELILTWFRDFAERNRRRTQAPTVEDTQTIEIGRLRQV